MVGRFLSPDPYVQAPDFSQSFNRYSYAYNNPLKFTDPSGEIIVPLLVGAGISVLTNGISNTLQGQNFFNGALRAATIGGLGGLAGGIAGQVVSKAIKVGGFLGGAAIGGASGFAGGFVGAAANSWLNGSSFGEGLLSGLKGGIIGGSTGAFIGGVWRGISDARKGFSFWDGSKHFESRILASSTDNSLVKGYRGSEIAATNDEYLKLRMFDEFHIQEGGNLADKITTVPPLGRYDLTGDGLFIRNNNISGGVFSVYSSGYTQMSISPNILFSDQVTFLAYAGHEVIHAFHHYALYGMVNWTYSERIAYKYTFDTYVGAGEWNKALNIKNIGNSLGFWGPAPNLYRLPYPVKYLGGYIRMGVGTGF